MKKIIKEIIDNNGYKITEESNENNQTIKRTTYNPDGVRIDWIEKYDPQTGNKIKKTYYNNLNSKKIDFIVEYDPQTGNKTKTTKQHQTK
ncbi:DUF2963 domain-containing protein [Candidatus Phytoplasma solani]|uniref:DUF2963 domain-containing protein n=1 Tax=Candidatus Phytoplasma solani TaxID=69896 RepID=UPI00358E0AFC